MISRIWRGWTTPDNAAAYEEVLRSHVFPSILAKNFAGFQRLELMRRDAGDEVEFCTIMWFDDLEAVREFAGEDFETAYVPPPAREVLARFDPRSLHYEIRDTVTP